METGALAAARERFELVEFPVLLAGMTSTPDCVDDGSVTYSYTRCRLWGRFSCFSLLMTMSVELMIGFSAFD